MEDKFLSVTEAMKFTGKVEATIRNEIKKLEIQNVSEDILIKEPFGKGYKYWISSSYLEERFGTSTKKNKNSSSKVDANDRELIEQLRSEITHLRSEIEFLRKKDERKDQRMDYLVKVLGERMQEDMNQKKLED